MPFAADMAAGPCQAVPCSRTHLVLAIALLHERSVLGWEAALRPRFKPAKRRSHPSLRLAQNGEQLSPEDAERRASVVQSALPAMEAALRPAPDVLGDALRSKSDKSALLARPRLVLRL